MNFIDTRAFIAGTLVAFVAIAFSFYIAPIIIEDDPVTPSIGDWDISSPTNVRTSMQNNIQSLIYTKVSVSKVVSTSPDWGTTPEIQFNHNVHSIILSIDLENTVEEQQINPNDNIWGSGVWKFTYSGNTSIDHFDKNVKPIDNAYYINSLHSGLSEDLDRFNSLHDVRSNFSDEIMEAEGINNVLFWEIDHVYNDGTSILIQSYGNLIFISQLKVLSMIVTEGSYGILFDPSTINPSYKTTSNTDNPFENYENVINDLISNIVEGN
jgi:hypothetical protein